jgi:hypothetical protein
VAFGSTGEKISYYLILDAGQLTSTIMSVNTHFALIKHWIPEITLFSNRFYLLSYDFKIGCVFYLFF